MSDIYITLNNEIARVTSADQLSSGDVDTVNVHFTFSEEWDAFPLKTMCVHTITKNEDKIGGNFVGISQEGIAVVPQKALSQAGKLFMAVVGENTEGTILTSSWATLRIVPGADFIVEDDENDVLGRLLPAGGEQGDFLVKASDEDYDYTWGGVEYSFDSEMSDTSLNGVQNAVIKAYVDSHTGTTYTAGDNIDITNNVISATDTTYTAGNGIALTNTQFSADNIKVVTSLPATPVENTEYVLVTTSDYSFSTNGLPEEFQSQSAYEEWASTGKAVMFALTDDTYTYVLFTGIEVNCTYGEYYYVESNSHTGAEYLYNSATGEWEGVTSTGSIAVNSDLIHTDLFQQGGTYNPWESDYIVKTGGEDMISSSIGLQWINGECVYITGTHSPSITYDENDNVMQIYEATSETTTIVTVYVYDGTNYIQIATNSTTGDLTAILERLSLLETSFVEYQETVDDIYALKAIYGDNSVSLNRATNTTVGAQSIAYGQGNTASAAMATALGQSNTASGQFSTVIGTGNTSSNTGSVAYGIGSNVSSGTGSLAGGSANTSSGNMSIAIGQGNTSSGVTSMAVGIGNAASSQGSIALGNSNTSSGSASVTLGASNSTTGQNDIIAGSYNVMTTSGGNNIVLGTSNSVTNSSRNFIAGYNNGDIAAHDSFVIGQDNTATGNGSGQMILGVNNTSSASYSVIAGQVNSVTGYDGIAIGSTNTAGQYGSAIGYGNTASGTNSVAIGESNTASGLQSVALGSENTASALNSLATGTNTIAASESQTVIGKYNISDDQDTYALIIGNGSLNDRSNLHTVDWNGNAVYSGEVTATETTTEEVGGETITTTTLHTLTGKQDKLTAGSNITITNNVISATGGGGGTSYTAGDNITISNDVISANIIEQIVTFSYNKYDQSITCNTAYSDIVSRYSSNTLKAQLYVYDRGTVSRRIPLTMFKYGGGTNHDFYFEYIEDDVLTTYLVKKDYTITASDVYTITATTQAKLTAGTGIDITNGVISLNVSVAEGGGF